MICDWTYDGINLQLHESNWGEFKSLDLIVRSGETPPIRIAINNGIEEILAAANQRDPKLLKIIRDHNTDLESLLDQQIGVQQKMIAASTKTAAINAVTKLRL